MRISTTKLGYPPERKFEPVNVLRMKAFDPSAPFHLWTGISGRHYAHTVYPLRSCPELPQCTYRMVKRDAAGREEILETGALESDAPSLNLAKVRQTAARLGATEVHVHLLANTRQARQDIVEDMMAENRH